MFVKDMAWMTWNMCQATLYSHLRMVDGRHIVQPDGLRWHLGSWPICKHAILFLFFSKNLIVWGVNCSIHPRGIPNIIYFRHCRTSCHILILRHEQFYCWCLCVKWSGTATYFSTSQRNHNMVVFTLEMNEIFIRIPRLMYKLWWPHF